MSALWAMIADTWRQSRQQVVFLVMVALLLVFSILAIVLAQPVRVVDEDGVEREHVSILGTEHGYEFLEGQWAMTYASSTALGSDSDVDPFSEEGQAQLEERVRAQEEFVREQARLDPARRGLEGLLSLVSGLIFSLSMLLFLGASANYFPAMLESGAIDIVLAKPLARWQVFLGKYLGGLALFTVAVAGANMLLFVGLGVRTGIWHPSLFLVMPAQILAAATLFGLIVLLGVLSRSGTLCMVVGYIYYLFVDSILQVLTIMPFKGAWVRGLKSALEWTPNFGVLKTTATVSVVNLPDFDPQPLFVCVIWTALVLGLAYWKFRQTDY